MTALTFFPSSDPEATVALSISPGKDDARGTLIQVAIYLSISDIYQTFQRVSAPKNIKNTPETRGAYLSPLTGSRGT